MHRLRQEDLPFVGSSHEFVGAEHGPTGVSVFLFHGKPGAGPHSFKAIGDSPLVQFDIHVNPRFVQENL